MLLSLIFKKKRHLLYLFFSVCLPPIHAYVAHSAPIIFLLVPASRGAGLLVSMSLAGLGMSIIELWSGPCCIMHGSVPLGGKNGLQPARMDGGMNNGCRDGGTKHYCNLCHTKLKTCLDVQLRNSRPSHPGWLVSREVGVWESTGGL